MKKKDAPKSVMTPEEVIAYKKKMIEQYEKQQKENKMLKEKTQEMKRKLTLKHVQNRMTTLGVAQETQQKIISEATTLLEQQNQSTKPETRNRSNSDSFVSILEDVQTSSSLFSEVKGQLKWFGKLGKGSRETISPPSTSNPTTPVAEVSSKSASNFPSPAENKHTSVLLKFSSKSNPSEAQATLIQRPTSTEITNLEPQKSTWLNTFNKEPTKREIIVDEILTTERSYCDSLKLLVKMYKVPLDYAANSEAPLLKHEEINSIFSNIEVIYNFSKEMLKQLEERTNDWVKNDKVGDIFMLITPFLKSYADYSKNYEKSIASLQKLISSNPEFGKFLDARRNVKNSMDIQSLLIMPIQRLPRYVLLLENLKKNTPEDHPDRKLLTDSLNLVKQVTSETNNVFKLVDNRNKILDIQSKFSGESFLLIPSRYYKREGPALVTALHQQKKFNGYLFLFNDILLIAKEKLSLLSEKSFAREEKIPLINSTFISEDEISFELAVNKTCSCKLTFKSPEEKKEWMTDVLQSIGDLLEKEALIKAQLQKKSKTQENKERSNSF